MPSPMIAHPTNNTTGEGAAASGASPAAKIRFDSISTPRPPIRSIRAPAHGPIVAETTMAQSTSSPLSAEERLARSIRDRIELEAMIPAAHADLVNAVATEDALRSLAFADDTASSRADLIAALADHLSAALADRSELPANADNAVSVRTEKVISGLLGAINTEVHRNRV